MARIFIIDSDPIFCETLGAIATGLGHSAEHSNTLAAAFPSPALRGADIIFLNTRLPDGNGLEVLPRLRTYAVKPEVIMITDAATADGAERAIRNGAWDYVAKQGAVDRMVLPLIRALDYRARRPSKREEVRLKRDSIIGSSPGLTRCLDIVSEAAASDASALLYGETGVGKEVFARAIHDNSQRHGSPFVAVDCASLSRTLAGSTLFGHRKGAFTGADKDRDGLVAQAHKGTLFLDEVGELPLAMQKIFLRVLQEHRFRPVGGRAEITSDFRLICATNRNIEEMVSRGTFRSDLLFRMRTVVMHIPPLRERIEDLPELAEHYTRRLCGKYGMPTKGLSTDLTAALKDYQWPGNVRELIHTLERAVLSAQDDPKLFSRHLPDHVRISIARAAAQGCMPVDAGGAGIDTSSRPDSPAGTPLHMARHVQYAGHTEHTEHTEHAEHAEHADPARMAEKIHSVTHSHPSVRTHADDLEDSLVALERRAHNELTDTFTPPLRPGAACALIDSPYENVSAHHRDKISAAAHDGASSFPSEPTELVTPAGGRLSNSAIADVSHSNLSANSEYQPHIPPLPPFFAYRDALFTDYLTDLMEQCNGDTSKACSISGLSRSYLYDLMKKYGIATPRRKR